GVVGFGGKRAAGGTFGCSACDVCFIRSAKFGGGAEFDEAEAYSARFASIGASCARACASSPWETVPAGLPLRSTRQAPCRSRRGYSGEDTYQRNAAESLPAGMAPSRAASTSSRMPSFNGRRPDSVMLKQHGHFSASKLITARIALWLI